jgi:rhodanese-related sulfurtransferase
VDAIAANKIKFLTMDVNIIKSIQDTTYDENEQDMIVEEMEENDDWMTTLLRSPIFRNLPPANLQKLLISLEEVNFKVGEVIIEQGEQGNYYYIIKKGQALISRKPSPSAKEIKLARLGDLDSFGEDALISGEPRNVTITAMTEMTLLRLAKDHFITLIKQPSLKYIDYPAMMDYVDKGADLIDVRGPDEYKKYHLPHSISVPFFSLRMYLKTLNRQHPIIVVCKNGRTSEAAAFVLLRHKFTALILQGGLDALDKELLKSPASFAIDDGVETGNFTGTATEIRQDESSEHLEESAEQEIEDASEEALRGTIESLTLRCQSLEAEKAALEIKCASLRRHLESMKAEIDRLKNAAS